MADFQTPKIRNWTEASLMEYLESESESSSKPKEDAQVILVRRVT